MQRPALLRCLGAMVEGGGEAAAATLLHTYGLLRVRVGVRVRLLHTYGPLAQTVAAAAAAAAAAGLTLTLTPTLTSALAPALTHHSHPSPHPSPSQVCLTCCGST